MLSKLDKISWTVSVGYELSPLFTGKKFAKDCLPVGCRALRAKIVVDREREINAFIPVEYWLLTAFLRKDIKDPAFRVRYHGELEGKKVVKKSIDNEAEAEALISDLDKADYIVHRVTKRQSKRQSKPPYTTSTLQQEASRKLGFTSARTMRVAQQLYEGCRFKRSGSDCINHLFKNRFSQNFTNCN